MADPAARASGLLSGSLDAIGSPDVNTATRMNRASGYELVQVSGTQHYTTDMRTDTGPLTDPNVRNAVKWALKRQEIVDNVLGGFATVGRYARSSSALITITNTTSSAGGNGVHNHGWSGSASSTFSGNAIDLSVSYVDVIVAQKD